MARRSVGPVRRVGRLPSPLACALGQAPAPPPILTARANLCASYLFQCIARGAVAQIRLAGARVTCVQLPASAYNECGERDHQGAYLDVSGVRHERVADGGAG